MSKIRVDTVATKDDSTSVSTSTLTGLPARMTAAETNKVDKGPNSSITSITGLTTPLAINQGGVGANTADGARSALGITGRNRIINGACSVAQRAAATFSTGTGGYGGPDRFTAVNVGTAGGSFTQSAGTIVDNGVTKGAVVHTVNTAIANMTGGNFWTGIAQVIEGINCFDLVGQPIGVSFLFKTNVTGTFSAAFGEGGNTYVTTFAATANVPVKVSYTIPANSNLVVAPNSTAGMTIQVGALNQGTLQTSSINTWVAAQMKSAVGATNWASAPGNYISLTDLQVEAGSPTPFERRLYGHELALCQRYYEEGSFSAIMGQTTTTSFGGHVFFAVSKRAAPTIVQVNTYVFNCSTTPQSSNSGYQVKGFLSYRTATAAGACQYNENWTASAEL